MCLLKLCLVIIFFTSPAVSFAQSEKLSAQAVLRNMAAKYAAVASYQDIGVVESIGGGSLPTRSTDISFKTYFTRTGKLRFEWTDVSPVSVPGRSILWSDGDKTFTHHTYNTPEIETEESLDVGIAGATGVSLGSAHTAPSLLMPGIGGFLLSELSEIELRRQEHFEGEECYVLEGGHPNGERWQLWIGKRDFLVRKLRKPTESGYKEEIHRDIKINAPIPEQVYHPKLGKDGRLTDEMNKDKEQNIRRLVELLFPRDRVNQTLNDELEMLKGATRQQIPEKVWQEVIAELHVDSELILHSYIPIYDSYYTDEEVKQLINFYESPLGRKLARNAVLIELEAARQGEGIGRELMKRVNEKLREKGYRAASTARPSALEERRNVSELATGITNPEQH